MAQALAYTYVHCCVHCTAQSTPTTPTSTQLYARVACTCRPVTLCIWEQVRLEHPRLATATCSTPHHSTVLQHRERAKTCVVDAAYAAVRFTACVRWGCLLSRIPCLCAGLTLALGAC